MDQSITPAPKPGGIDFSNWSYNTLPERTGNVGWQPDLQDPIYTAINHVEGDYEDADENCAEQVIERLVLAVKALLVETDRAREAEADAQASADTWLAEHKMSSARSQALEMALTPSAETKAAYMGEFRFPFPVRGPEGDDIAFTPNVPRTTIREIMAAIRAQATSAPAASL
jgi:hypothetical protein